MQIFGDLDVKCHDCSVEMYECRSEDARKPWAVAYENFFGRSLHGADLYQWNKNVWILRLTVVLRYPMLRPAVDRMHMLARRFHADVLCRRD